MKKRDIALFLLLDVNDNVPTLSEKEIGQERRIPF
jgi:hypothetical protein